MKVAFIGLGNMGASLAKAVAKKWLRKTCSWSIVLLKGARVYQPVWGNGV